MKMQDKRSVKEPMMLRCRNCSLNVKIKQLHSIKTATIFMKTILQTWIAPTQVTSDDYLCKQCFCILKKLKESKTAELPKLGNRCVCYGCGISLLETRSRSVLPNSLQRNLLIKNIPPHLVSRLVRVCCRCWYITSKKVQRDESFDSERNLEDQTGGVSKKLLDTPRSIKIRKPIKRERRSSSTESADNEMLGYRQERRQTKRKQVKNKGPTVAKTSAYSISRSKVDVKQKKNDLLTVYDGLTPSENIEALVSIIYRVFHYLQRELEYMKNYTKGSCDLTPLCDVLKRTVAATGVSEETVLKVLKYNTGEELKRDRGKINQKKRKKKLLQKYRRGIKRPDTNTIVTDAVAMDHTYYHQPTEGQNTSEKSEPVQHIESSEQEIHCKEEEDDEPIEDLVMKCEVFDEEIEHRKFHDTSSPVAYDAQAMGQPVVKTELTDENGYRQYLEISPLIIRNCEPTEKKIARNSLPSNEITNINCKSTEKKIPRNSLPSNEITNMVPKDSRPEETLIKVKHIQPKYSYDMEYLKFVKIRTDMEDLRPEYSRELRPEFLVKRNKNYSNNI